MRRASRYRAAAFLAWATLGALAGAGAAGGQERPIDLPWMRPPPGPPPEYPAIFVAPGELAEPARLPLDARAADAHRAGRLPGALRPRLEDGCVAAGVFCVRERLAALGLTGREPVVVYGDDPEAVGRLFWLLEWAGFREVRVLAGGLDAWRAAGGEVAAGEPTRQPSPGAADLAVPVGEAAVDRSWLLATFGTPAVEVVDLRGAPAWEAAAGHVPHSLPFDFRSLLPEDGGWPDAPAARRTLGRLGPRRGTYVDLAATFVVYGEGPADRRLGLAYLLLRALGVSAAVYPGGWADWRSAPDGPVVRIVGAGEVARRLEAGNPGLAEDRASPDLALFDVRGEISYQAGHLPGASSLPVERCAEALPALAAGRPAESDRRASPVAFYCYGRDCIRSRNCSTLAARAGFRDVLWLRDGLPGWEAAGLPVFRSAPPAAAR